MRVAPKITLTEEIRQTLECWSRGRSTPARLVSRAKIVLAAAEGLDNHQIADKLEINRLQAGKWRWEGARKTPARGL